MKNKTEEIVESVFDAILFGTYGVGDKIPSEREMMEQTGVSRITIRRAYAALIQRGILIQKHGAGSFVANRFRGWGTSSSFLAVMATLEDPFALEYINALEETATENGLLLIVKQTHQDPTKEIESCISLVKKGVRNLIVWASGTSTDFNTYARLRVLGCNLVFFDRMKPGALGDYVGVDSDRAMEIIVRDISASGALEALFLTYDSCTWDSLEDRRQAFEEQCTAAGIRYRVLRLQSRSTIHGCDSRRVELRRLLDVLRGQPAVCANDYIAMDLKWVSPESTVFSFDGLDRAVRLGVRSYQPDMPRMAEQTILCIKNQWTAGNDWSAGTYYVSGTFRSST